MMMIGRDRKIIFRTATMLSVCVSTMKSFSGGFIWLFACNDLPIKVC